MDNQPSNVLTASERQWRINHAGKIARIDFEVILGVFSTIAVLAGFIRTFLRFKLRGALALDDIFVAFATICLVILTVLVHHVTSVFYLVEAAGIDPEIILTEPEAKNIKHIFDTILAINALDWTIIYSIKFSFLAFFKAIIRKVSTRLTRYYWFAVVFTALTWIYVVIIPFIICPYPGLGARGCINSTSYQADLAWTCISPALDIITDAMIISIPMIILNMTQLNRAQKLRIAVFLCLSAVMMIVALVRVIGSVRSGLHSKRHFDTIWEAFWQHFETTIAVTMGSITAMRTIFRGQTSPNATSLSTDPTFRWVLVRLGFSKRQAGSNNSAVEMKSDPKTQNDPKTATTIRGIRTFIRRGNRETGSRSMTVDSEINLVEEYHHYQRESNYAGRQSENDQHQDRKSELDSQQDKKETSAEIQATL